MKFIWHFIMNMMLTLTGLTILAGLLLGFDVMVIVTRSALVLIGSGLLFTFVAMLLTRGYRQEEWKRSRLKKQNQQEKGEAKEADRKEAVAA